MAKLVFKNTGTTDLYVNDMGVGIAPGEDLDLIPNYRDEDILESTDLQTAMQAGGEVWLNDVEQLSYQDLIDYLTKLTKYDTLDFNYISNEDSDTDVTGSEIEQLTNGSDTSLHNHDNRYYTQTQLSTSGQSIVDWGNIVNSPIGDEFTVVNGQIYVFDSIRNKTLSVFEQNYSFGSRAANGRFLDVGSGFGFDVGYVVPFNATITRITISASSGWDNKDVEVRKNNTVILDTITMTNNIVSLNDINIDVSSSDIVQVFIPAGGPALKRVNCTLYIRERI